MKIDGDSNLSPLRNDPVDRAGPEGKTGTPATGSRPGEDSLRLSPDAEIAREAIKRAAALPEIRHDQVERVRKLLEHGEVGRDPERLADAIIDSLVDHPVDGRTP